MKNRPVHVDYFGAPPKPKPVTSNTLSNILGGVLLLGIYAGCAGFSVLVFWCAFHPHEALAAVFNVLTPIILLLCVIGFWPSFLILGGLVTIIAIIAVNREG